VNRCGAVKTYDAMANARATVKLAPEKWAKSDPDDQKRLSTLANTDVASGGLSDIALQNLVDVSTSALTNDNIDVTTETRNYTESILAAARARGTITIPPGF
jgi:hypothetical protein